MDRYKSVLKLKPRDPLDAFRHMVNEYVDGQRRLYSRRNDAWEPPTDVYETEEEVVIKMSLPGVRPGRIRVEFNVDSIVVSGYREAGKENGLVAYHQMEIRNGYFERCIMVQQPIDPENTTAEYSEGFLVVHIPKVKKRLHKVYAVRFQLR